MEKSQNKNNETLKNEGNISVRNSTKNEKENTPAEPLSEESQFFVDNVAHTYRTPRNFLPK